MGHAAISSWESGSRTIPGPILKLIEIYEREAGISLEHLQTSWFSRHFRLAAAVAGVTTRFAGHSIFRLMGVTPTESFTEASAKKIAGTMSELKGLIMKAGQMIGYTDFGLPEPIRNQFAYLQDQSMPLTSVAVQGIIEQELGVRAPKQICPQPIGVGSIGQVHEVTLTDGTELVFKVQYPDIEKLMKSDLKYAHFLDLFGPFVFPKQNRAELIRELHERASDECDYLKEAAFQEKMRAHFQGFDRVMIPKTYPDFCTRKILAQEKMNGLSFQDFLSSSDQAARNQVGKTLFEVAFRSAFQLKILNCDPHPGNYLFSQAQVTLLDFGGTIELQDSLVLNWKRLLLALHQEDRETVGQLVMEFGYVPNKKGFDFDQHYELMRLLHLPWLVGGKNGVSYRFDREYMIQCWTKMFKENANRTKLCLPREWIFINRLQWGLFSILATLNAEANWGEIMLPLLKD